MRLELAQQLLNLFTATAESGSDMEDALHAITATVCRCLSGDEARAEVARKHFYEGYGPKRFAYRVAMTLLNEVTE